MCLFNKQAKALTKKKHTAVYGQFHTDLRFFRLIGIFLKNNRETRCGILFLI